MSAKQKHADAKSLFMELSAVDEPTREARYRTVDQELASEVRSLLAYATPGPLLDSDGPSADDPLGIQASLVDERYRIERMVAEGGFSYVYRAEQVRWRRPVAIKVFKIAAAREGVVKEAFIKEGALLAELSQLTTAIVQSYDIGELRDAQGGLRLFMALEWLEGRTLAADCGGDMFPPWSMEKLLGVLAPIAQGLGVAHASGIAHRDVKPSNIFLLARSGALTSSKLLDFGVAKVAAENEGGFERTGNTIKAFTLGYGAPEQYAQLKVPTGPWTDVYALALVCSELLAGRRVVNVDNPVSAMRRLNAPDTSATPRQLGAKVSRGVERVFQKALAPDVRVRFANADLFWEALRRASRRHLRG